ncbi:class I SAM-dependent methyltransferase [Candidatus Omnitrophota bacterium]
MEIIPCNLCQGQDLKFLYKINNLRVVKCLSCGLIFVNPRLKEERFLEMYENNYFQRNVYAPDQSDFYGYVDYLADSKNIIRTFEHVFGQIKVYKQQGRLFDVGCAFGFFLDLARKDGWQACGLEPSSQACAYAREKLDLAVDQGTLAEATLPAKTFDLVTMFDVIEHLCDPLAGLVKVNRSLKDDGLLVVSTPNADSLLAKILGKKLEDARRTNEHLYMFSRKTIAAMLKKCGFAVLKIRPYGKFFSLGDLLERSTLYHQGLFKGLKFVLEKIKMDNLTVYVNPRVKMTVFAKKVKEVTQKSSR